MPRKTVTIKDIALRAGVSFATVSRALSGRGYVSDHKKDIILRAAQELGYKPHAAARSLKLERTNTIGLMVTDITNPFYSYLASGALTCAQRYNYHMILCATDEDPALEQEYLEVLMEERVDGIIAVPTSNNVDVWQEAVGLGVKLVFVDREVAGVSNADVVMVDNVKGAYDAVAYLLELGHRRIGIISGPSSTTTGRGRLQGYYDALAAAQIATDQDLVRIGTFKRESGFQAARWLLSLAQPPTAIFAANNVLGEATMFALREHDVKIPDQISLVLFDDVPWASLTSPQVTVVAQPTYSLGVTSVDILNQRLRKGDEIAHSPTKTMLQPQLIIRESCMVCPRSS